MINFQAVSPNFQTIHFLKFYFYYAIKSFVFDADTSVLTNFVF